MRKFLLVAGLFLLIGVVFAYSGLGAAGQQGRNREIASTGMRASPQPIRAAATLARMLDVTSQATLTDAFSFGQSVYYLIDDDVNTAKPNTVAVGDVTGDGRDDAVLVTTNRCGFPNPESDFKAFVYSQAADGSLQEPVKYSYDAGINYRAPCTESGIALADLNHDGVRDVVIGYGLGIAILLTDGAGGLDVSTYVAGMPNGAWIEDVGVLDVDLDGNLDIVSHSLHNAATIFFGNGHGGIASKQQIQTAASALQEMEIGDVTGDGLPDMVVVNWARPEQFFWVYPHNGVNGFGPARVYQPIEGYSFAGLAIGDWNGDGRNDVAISHEKNAPTAIYVYYQDGQGQLLPPVPMPSKDGPGAMISADLNHDGRQDLVTTHGGWDVLGHYLQEDSGLGSEVLSMIYDASRYNGQGLAAGDLNGDGCTDVALANYNFGLVVAPGRNCRRALADFDGDGRADVFWRNALTGANMIWRAGRTDSLQAVVGVSNQNWQVAGIGDFNGDGKTDLFWRNTSSGANNIWKSGNAATQQLVKAVTSQSWQVVGKGDFDGDARADVFWRNSSTGANAIWKSGNADVPQAVPAVTNQDWKVVGVCDFDGDGKSDVFWRNTRTGANTIWKSGNASTQQAVASTTLNWTLAGTGDFNGDGEADLLWRNTKTGANTIWKSGKVDMAQAVAAVTNQNWQVVAVADYDADDTADILWRNRSTGANTIWKSARASTAMGTLLDTAWNAVP